MYGNKFIRALATPLGYLIALGLLIYMFGERVTDATQHMIHVMENYSAGKEMDKR